MQAQNQQCYPLTPNICVEAGRIQFIRPEIAATTEGVHTKNDPAASLGGTGRVTVTRGQQTELHELEEYEYERVGGDEGI